MFYNMFSPTRSITVLMVLTTVRCAAAGAQVSCSKMFRETNMCYVYIHYIYMYNIKIIRNTQYWRQSDKKIT